MSSYISRCKYCGQSVFWLQDDNGKNIPFEDSVIEMQSIGKKFADGFDNIRISTDTDVRAKTKGFICHFGRCK